MTRHRLSGTLYRTSLKEILETGQLGQLRIGMTEEAATTWLGPPDGSIESLRGYGDIEVSFLGISEEGTAAVWYIKFPWKWGWGFHFPPNIHLDGFVPNYDTTFDEFAQYLEEADIRHTVEWIDIYDEHFPVIITEIEGADVGTKPSSTTTLIMRMQTISSPAKTWSGGCEA